jgi:hypothetical protein
MTMKSSVGTLLYCSPDVISGKVWDQDGRWSCKSQYTVRILIFLRGW